MSIVLDANIVIALLQPEHIHHDMVVKVLGDLEEDSQGKIAEIHRLTMAEVLAGFSDVEVPEIYDWLIFAADLRVCDIPADEEIYLLVAARQDARVRMPDACVLASAMWVRDSIMTFDKRLIAAAHRVGVDTFKF